MSALLTLVDQVLAHPLAAARAAPRAIGYVGMDIPEDLLAAGNLHASHLPWDADRETPRANAWLESAFAPWCRSIIEDWADGKFDFMEAVVFTRGEDSAQRLYYYICELQRRGDLKGPKPLIFDVARIDRATSVDRTTEGVRRLARQLGLSESDVGNGITTANRRRAFYAALDAGRQGPGSSYERIARSSLFASLDAELAGFMPVSTESGGRLLLAGNAPPDDRLHRAIETVGWTVSGEAHDRSLLRLGPAVRANGDPYAAIAEQVYAQVTSTRSFADRAIWLVDEARRAKADAVLLWLVEEEEALVWHLPAQKRALEAAGLPCLALSRRRWDAGDGAAEVIATFLEGLKL